MRNTSFRSLFWGFLLCFITTITLYYGLFSIFYQQDEWIGIGLFHTYPIQGTLHGLSFFSLVAGVGRPLMILFHQVFYGLFPFQIWPFALFSITLHALICISFYYFLRLIRLPFVLSVLTVFFSLISYTGSQALIWYAANTTTLPSVLFFIFSIIFYTFYLEGGKRKYVLLSQLCFIVSFLFKESSAAGLLFLLIWTFIFPYRTIPIVKALKSLWIVLLYSLYAIGFRVISYFTAPILFVDDVVGTRNYLDIILHVITYPLTTVLYTLLPQPISLKLINAVATFFSFSSRFTATTICFSLLSSLYIFCGILLTLKNKSYRFWLIMSLLWIFCSIVPYIFLVRVDPFLDSRYLYQAQFGSIFLFIIFLYLIVIHINIKLKKIVIVILCIGLSILIFKHIQILQRELWSQKLIAKERKLLLQQIKQQIPSLPNNPIFYVQGTTNHYLIPHQYLPFQQGIGFTLMAWYKDDPSISSIFFSKEPGFFWNIYNEGYKTINEHSFGYFYSLDTLKELFNTNPSLSTEQIVAIWYDGGSKQIKNITEETKKLLFLP